MLGIVAMTGLCALGLKYRLYGRLSIADIAIPAICLTPLQWESLFATPNFAQGAFPLLLLVLVCLAWTLDRVWLRYSLVIFLVFLATFTGFTLFLGVLTPLVFLLDYHARPPHSKPNRMGLATGIGLSLVSLALFSVNFHINADIDCFSPAPHSPFLYFAFVSVMLAKAFGVSGTAWPSFLVGSMLLASFISVLATNLTGLPSRKNAIEHNATVVSSLLLGFSLLVCFSAAYARICGGLDLALAPRYAIYIEPAVLGTYLYLYGLRHAPLRRILLAAGVFITLGATFTLNIGDVEHVTRGKAQWRACYLNQGSLQQCNSSTDFLIYTHPPERTNLADKLLELRSKHLNFGYR